MVGTARKRRARMDEVGEVEFRAKGPGRGMR